MSRPPVEPTPKDVVARDGTSRLLRFRGRRGANEDGPVVVFVPSLINRWYILDLRPGASVAQAFVDAGFDTYCLDWGVPEDEDRYLSWEDVLARLNRMVRRVCGLRGVESVGVLGYCMGGTLSGIYAALHPERVGALLNLAGPFDFSEAGTLAHMVDPRWFDADAVADAGNVSPTQMQSGFSALRPTTQIAKFATLASRGHDADFMTAFTALDGWADDNVPFPGEAYRTYIGDLYQKNALVAGEHWVAGKRVDLGRIACPVMSVVASRDHICPPAAATGLNRACGSEDQSVFEVAGGHVGAVVGSRARTELYPAITKWFGEALSTA